MLDYQKKPETTKFLKLKCQCDYFFAFSISNSSKNFNQYILSMTTIKTLSHTRIHNWSLQSFNQDYNLTSNPIYVVFVNCLHEWRNLQFKVNCKIFEKYFEIFPLVGDAWYGVGTRALLDYGDFITHDTIKKAILQDATFR